MKWRLREGQGEAIYEIGVEDSGVLAGLSDRDMCISLQTLRQMAEKLGATITVLQNRLLDNGRNIAEVLVRKVKAAIKCKAMLSNIEYFLFVRCLRIRTTLKYEWLC